MLHLILGRSGYGKSQKILQKIKEVVKNDDTPLIIVPDQFSFEMERTLYFNLGVKKSINTEVLGFSRLAHTIFREYGGTARNYITDGGKNLLVHMAITEVIDNLDLYKKSALGRSFIKDITATISELKQSSVAPEELYRVVQGIFLESLKQKGEEISLIYQSYNALLKAGYDDTDDNLTRALELIRKHNFFAGKTVLIDEFKGFTTDELLVIEEMIKQCKNVYIALTTDKIYDDEGGIGLFSYVEITSSRLVSMAKKHEIPVAVPIILKDPKRFKAPELIHLEKNLFSNKKIKSRMEYFKDSEIKVYQADNIYNEMEFVAATISQIVAINGLRYKDIAVLGRNIDVYENALSTMMGRYEIPYFYSVTKNVYSLPYLMFITSVLQVATDNYNTDSLFALMKTGLTNLQIEEIAELENYIYIWDIKAKAWEKDFTQNPRGFVNNKKEEDDINLNRINVSRRTIIEPIAEFKNKIKNEVNGVEFARNLYELIEKMKIDENYLAIINNLESDESKSEYKQVWDHFSTTLDEYADLLKTTNLSLENHNELLKIMIESMEIGEIPQNIDQVLVGDASLTRPNNPKITFVVGANEGVFPMIPKETGIFTSDERELLMEMDINLSDNLEKKTIDERFILYKALSSSSEGLYITYPIYGIKGEPAYPSTFIKEIFDISGGAKKISKEEFINNTLIQNPLSALYSLGRNYNKKTTKNSTVKKLLERRGIYEKNLLKLEELSIENEFKIINKELTKQLYGDFLRLSPTKVEKFMGCKFSYFAQYGLKLEKRKKAKLSPLEIGSLVHYALQILLEKYGEGIVLIDKKDIQKDIKEILDNYIEEFMGGVEDKTKRFKYLYNRLTNTLEKLIEQLAKEFSQSNFHPTDFELVVGEGGVKPIKLLLPTGEKVLVEGVIDRVDIMKKDRQKYIRVVDYKTGGKDFKLSDVYHGLNMQMLIYLFSIWKNGEEKYKDVIPAGVLYMPAKTTAIDTKRNTDEEEMENLQKKSYKMQGLVLNNTDVIYGMEKGGGGIFINVKLTKAGVAQKGAMVASLKELGRLQNHIENLIAKMAGELYDGRAEAFPIKAGQTTTCDWCSYNSVCGHEVIDRYKELSFLKNEEVFKKLEEEEKSEVD